MTADELLDAAVIIVTTWPDATLTPNPVNGISIDVDGKFVAWFDPATGEIHHPKEALP